MTGYEYESWLGGQRWGEERPSAAELAEPVEGSAECPCCGLPLYVDAEERVWTSPQVERVRLAEEMLERAGCCEVVADCPMCGTPLSAIGVLPTVIA